MACLPHDESTLTYSGEEHFLRKAPFVAGILRILTARHSRLEHSFLYKPLCIVQCTQIIENGTFL